MDKKLSDEIVEYLFSNGNGDKATRLVLELEDGSNGGGWSRAAVKKFLISMTRTDPLDKKAVSGVE